MEIEALSGVAAKLALAVLLAGGQIGLRTAGEQIGVRRYPSLWEAAGALHKAGIVVISYARNGLVVLDASPQVRVALLRLAGGGSGGVAGATVEGGEKDMDGEIRLDDGLSLYLSRYPSFVDQGITKNVRPLTENVIGLTKSVNPPTQTVYDNRNTSYENRNTSYDNRNRSYENRNTLPESSDTAGSEEANGDEATVDHLDALHTAVERADALPAGPVSNQRASTYVRRRKAQTDALLALWRYLLPGTSVTGDSVVRLLQEAGNSATVVAEMITQTADRLAAGQAIHSPWGYMRAALRNKITATTKPPATTATAAEWGELAPMTPAFQADLDALKQTADKYHLWG